ncbi:MAG: DNA primase [Elusimicrobiota bacterium]
MEQLDALRARLDLLELARGYLKDIKRTGRSWSACCPFHEEKTPSFNINTERGLYYCFGCNAGGDAIRFYQQVENVSFPEAIEALCEIYGLPKPAGRAVSGEEKLKGEMRKALELAQGIYRSAMGMREDPAADAARRYLDGRKLTAATLERFAIGLAPRGPNWLLSMLVTKHGVEPRILEKAGLATLSSRDGKYIDFFRGRILFPVSDTQGRVVGFGGRVIGTDQYGPKYLNSPDTLLFHKSDILFGLSLNKDDIRRQNKVFIVEGYFDVAGLYQAGVNLAVAPMGGSLTPNHARMLKRFADNCVILFDPDAAGMNGAVRAARLLIAQGLTVRVLNLPDGLDPDEYVLAHGKAAFEELEKTASKDFLEFELDHRRQMKLDGKARMDSATMLALAKEMLPTLAAIISEVERREAVIRIAQALRLDATGLERELWNFVSSQQRTSVVPAAGQGADAKARTPEGKHWDLSLEESILAVALADAQAVRGALEDAQVTAMDFDSPSIAHYVLSSGQDAGEAEWQQTLARISLTAQTRLHAESLKDRIAYYVEEFKRRKLKRELENLRKTMDFKRTKAEPCEPQMLARYAEISKILKA